MWWTIHLDGGPRRVNHAAVTLGDYIYSFGGYCSGPNYDASNDIDVFILDTVTYRWYQVTPRKENPDNIENSEFIDATLNGQSFSDYDSDEEHPYDIPADVHPSKVVPYQRYGHTVVKHDGKAYLWGGRNDHYGSSSELHEFNPANQTWTTLTVSGSIPPARDGHTAVVYNDKMYIFGGFENSHRVYSNSLYAYTFATGKWELLVTSGMEPSCRDFHASCVIGSKMYLFGGRGEEQMNLHDIVDNYCDKMYTLDLDELNWEEVDVVGARPAGRRSHSMWEYRGKLFLFGGYDSTTDVHFDDIHVFDPATKTWQQRTPYGSNPSPRRRQCSAIVGDRVFIFGGTAPSKTRRSGGLYDLADLYVLDYSVSLKTLAANRVIELYPKGIKSLPYLGLRMTQYLNNIIRPNTITNVRAEA